MTYVSCPHCGENIAANVVPDIEGDFGVIGGTHHVYIVEDFTQNCDCPLTEAELDQLEDALVERYCDPDDWGPDPDAAWDARFEREFD